MWEYCKDLQDELISLRREFHKMPEIGDWLPDTQARVCEELDKMGIPYKKNTIDSGIIAMIDGGRPGSKVVALRADMDGLPVTEATGLPFASCREGRMHACGHDTHITMLLGAAKVLNEHKDEIPGRVKLIFQTGEETCTGAKNMLKEGALENPHVDAIFGMHSGTILGPDIPSGTFTVSPGCTMASYDHFVIKVTGHGTHGSAPEKGIDPIVAASNIVLALEEIIAREIPGIKPAVLTIGQFHAGFAYNVIPNEVVIEGTTRALEEDVRQYLSKRIEEISKGIAATYRATADYEMIWGAAPLVNDPEMAALAADAAEKVVGPKFVVRDQGNPVMGGEDFAYYLAQRKGAFFVVSTANHEKHTDYPHHNPKFDVDEDILWKGAAVYVSTAIEFLSRS